MNLPLLRLALLSVVPLAARGDIAPTTFTGTDIFPLQNAEVRMAEADVRIVWGNPCALTARFAMVNESGQDQSIEVGFPVGAYHMLSEPNPAFPVEDDENAKPLLEPVGPEFVKITVNDEIVTAYRRLPPEKIKEIRRHYTTWYFAKITVRPGANTVSVATRLTPSGLYHQPFKRLLSYCISTGGRWKGPIGRETVEIAFPGLSAADLTGGKIPASGRIAGESVRWEFTDFEPQGREYDIDLEFLLPSVHRKLGEIRQAHEQHPADPQAALRYAAHLFVLGFSKGNSGFPPQKLDPDEFQKILEAIGNPGDREIFSRFYRKSGDGFASDSTEWTDDRKELVRIFADAGYCQDYPGITHVREARALVEGCLARNPRDAAAWNVYLTHFWRFSFAARGHWFGSSVYSQPLRAAIESAHRNCPEDPRIGAWHKAMQEDGQPPSLPRNPYGTLADTFKSEFSPQ